MKWWCDDEANLTVNAVIQKVHNWIQRGIVDKEVWQDIQGTIGFDLPSRPSPPPSPPYLLEPPCTSQGIVASQHPARNTATPYQDPNPPTIILLPRKVKKCYGCKRQFTNTYRCSPRNLVFKMKAYRDDVPDGAGGFRPPTQPKPAYFHLKLDCLRKEKSIIEEREMIMHHEIYRKLEQGHVDMLKRRGWWPYIQQWLFPANNDTTQ